MTMDDLIVHKGNAARHGLKDLHPQHLPGNRCVALTTLFDRSSVGCIGYRLATSHLRAAH
jgi:hypothetical protein